MNKSVEKMYVAIYRVSEDREWRVRDGTAVGRSQTANARDEETSQRAMLYTLTSTPTLDGVSPFNLGSLALWKDAMHAVAYFSP